MISFGSFLDMKYDQYDEIWLVVRSLKSRPKAENVYWYPELSPSKNLFFRHLGWKKNGSWNRDKFDNEYVTQFLSDFKNNKEGRNYLNELYKKGVKSNILVVCYCKDENICHRRILKGLIQGAYKKHNCMNIVNSDKDDSKYFELYKAL